MHECGVIHTDLKLENILLASPEYEDEYPMAKLCDFGLSHLLDEKGPNNGTKVFDIEIILLVIYAGAMRYSWIHSS